MNKFIIFSQQRSGSHYLRYLLNAHKDIHCNSDFSSGDIDKKGIDWAYTEGFKTHKTDIKTIGFLAKFRQNLHYDIARYPSTKVILLLRCNRLATLLSKLIASAFGCYEETGLSLVEAKRKRSELYPINVPIEDVEKHIIYWEEKEAEVFLFLEDQMNCTSVYYEELSDNEYVHSIYDWLDVPWNDTKVVEQKQGRGYGKLDPRPIEEAIENYNELVEHFKERING